MSYRAAYLEKTSTGEKVVVCIGNDENQLGDYSPIENAKWCSFIFSDFPIATDEIKEIILNHHSNPPMCCKINTSTGEILLRNPADILADYGE